MSRAPRREHQIVLRTGFGLRSDWAAVCYVITLTLSGAFTHFLGATCFTYSILSEDKCFSVVVVGGGMLQTVLLFISANCLPHMARCLKLSVWCAACGSLLWDPGLYIRPLGGLRVHTFHSTSERFPQCNTPFSSSPLMITTTVWFLDETDTLALVDSRRGASRRPAKQALGLECHLLWCWEIHTYDGEGLQERVTTGRGCTL